MGFVKWMKLALTFVMIVTLLLPYGRNAAHAEGTGVNVYVNGRLAAFDGQQPTLSGTTTVYVPLEAFVPQAGWMLESVAGYAANQRITLLNNAGTALEIRGTEGSMVSGGAVVQTVTNPTVVNGVVMIPLSKTAELLNAQVVWDSIGQAAYVFTPIFSGYSDKWAIMTGASQAPVIDGTMDEPLWNDAAVLDRFQTAGDNVLALPGPSAKVTYDQQNLYVGVSISSAPGEAAASQRGFHVILSSPEAPEAYYDIPVIVQNGSAKIIPTWGPGYTALTNFTSSTKRSDYTSPNGSYSTWTTEIAVPLSAVQQAAIAAGDEWGINVLTYKIVDHHPIFQSWYPVLRSSEMNWAADTNTTETYNFKADIAQEGRLGQLFFGSLPQPEQQAGSNVRQLAPWQPQAVRLEYKSFTELGLSFAEPVEGFDIADLQLKWKSPSGERTTITNVQTSRADGRIIVKLQHPNPAERGMYELEMTLAEVGNPAAGWGIVSFDGQQLIEAGMRAYVHQLTPSTGAKQHVAFTAPSANVQTLLGLIPDKVGLYYLGDPTRPDLAPRTLFNWSVTNPSVVTSTVSQQTFPNASYPETDVLSVKSRTGQTVIYPYYRDASGKKYFFSAQVWYKQREYVLSQMKTLATTDPLGAARLMYRFAQKYENYVPVNDYLWNQFPVDPNTGDPAVYWGGLWSYWYVTDLTAITNLLAAYQTVKLTDAFDQLSAEAGENVERKIVEGMLKPTVNNDRSYSIVNGNYDYQMWLGYLSMAKALGEPDYVHDTMMLMNNYLSSTYLSDGFFQEVTISYHDQSTNGFSGVSDQMKTWSDPAGYTSPRTGIRLDNPDIAQQFPILGKAKQISQMLVYPNGYVVPLNDTWAYTRKSRIETGSLLLPAAGVARLSRNNGEDESQLYLKFSANYGHYHNDPLDLTLFADGQELLPDIGYTHTFYRYPSVNTIGHNTVLVDSKDMSAAAAKDGGNLELFAPIGPSLQIMRAREEKAYPGLGQYSREPWFIGLPNGDGKEGYVVDVFRVSGGSRHEYTLQGDANHDAAFETSVPMTVYGDRLLPPGTTAIEAATELETGSAEGNYPGYIYVKNVKQADIADGRYDVNLATKDDGGLPMDGMTITGFTGDGASKLFLGTYPSVRMSRLDSTKDTNAEAVKYTMPKLVVRREGTGLKSTFTTVMEPYANANGPVIESKQMLNADSNETGNVALKIAYGSYTDYVLSSNDPSQPFTVGDMTLTGKSGFIRMKDGVIETMTLVGGTLLRKGDYEVMSPGTVTGAITGIARVAEGAADNAIVTDTEIPQSMVGRYVIVTHPDNTTNGYPIKSIRTVGHRSTIVLDDSDPGFHIAEDGSSRMTSYPFKQWSGSHRFTIDNVTTDVGAGSLQLAAAHSTLTAGASAALSLAAVAGTGAAIDLSGADSFTVTSSDTNIATVSGSGAGLQVNAVAPGTALLTAVVKLHGIELQQTIPISVVGEGYPIRVSAPAFTDGNGNPAANLTGLSEVHVSVQATNLTGSTMPVILLVTACDSGGNALSAPLTAAASLVSGETKLLSVDTDVSGMPAGGFLKAMVWDSEDGMMPYSGETHFPN